MRLLAARIQLRIDSCQKNATAIEQSVAQWFAQFSPEQKYRYAKASFFDRASKCSLSFRACGSGADQKYIIVGFPFFLSEPPSELRLRVIGCGGKEGRKFWAKTLTLNPGFYDNRLQL